ncbi:MAG: sodium:solute symporter [Flavobacteriales bacterium]|nr:sodium:solute symporter [Flavobacteriales bacterium]
MSPLLIFLILFGYFGLLIFVAYKTRGDASNESFFIGKRKSPWYIVSYGMIGATLSGITFLSVPGWVGESEFFYMQMVFGYVPGYLFVAYILLPMYYKLNVYSIYEYLKKRFGYYSHRSGASYFFLSRLLGASLRLYLVALVLQSLLFDQIGVPFYITTCITILLIWIYTYRGGIRTIIWTDTLQTTFMLVTVITCIFLIYNDLNFISIGDSLQHNTLKFRLFSFDDFNNSSHFFRSFFSGMFIAIAMTGLDQDMMQKNLSCKNLKEAQKNMIWFSLVLVFVNIFFLYLGALLYQYADFNNIASSGDNLFVDIIKYGELGVFVFVLFFLGLMSAAYSSADSALTSLTTCFCIDFLDMKQKDTSTNFFSQRNLVHVLISLLLFLVILLVNYLNNDSIIATLFLLASFTYGPLLGLFVFGLFTQRKVIDRFVPIVVLVAPCLSYLLYTYDTYMLNGFNFGPDLIIVNAIITCGLLFMISSSKKSTY